MKRIKNLIIQSFDLGMVTHKISIQNVAYCMQYTFGSVLRLFFDLLHGIKRMDVPLMMVLEFTILLGYDGQLEQSDMEKELFNSAIDQLKERSEIII